MNCMNSCQQSIVNYKKKTAGYTQLGSGLTSYVSTIYALDAEHVYIGGGFASASSITVNNITMWNGITPNFYPLSTGLNGAVSAIYALSSSQVYIGGKFTDAGNANGDRITMWNGTTQTFAALGSGIGGVNSYVNAIYALDADHVYIGGNFSNVGSTNGDGIIRWNGTTTQTFTALGSGISALSTYVNAIYALDADHVYIGGNFSNIGSTNGDRITMWNGTTQIFTALGSGIGGVNTYVNAIYALDADHVYIGGNFPSAGGISANNITMWNGTTQTFTALGSGVSGGSTSVNAIYALDETHVYIGGIFTSAGGTTVNNITMWNGTTQTFTALGAGVNGTVNSIHALDNTHVYIGGTFTSAGGDTSIKYITMWNG